MRAGRRPRSCSTWTAASARPTARRRARAYNGHFACTCYHPLFVFNQFGDLERCALRPGNVHSADGWREVLVPVVARYRHKMRRRFFRGDAGFAEPGHLRVAGSRRLQIRDPPAGQCGAAGEHRLAAQAPGGSAAARGASLLRQLPLPGRLMEQAPPGRGQGRVASRRTVSARRVHRHQHDPAGRAGGGVLQPPRHGGAVDQGGQERGQLDAAVLPPLRAPTPCGCNCTPWPTTWPTSCAPWRLPEAVGAVVADDACGSSW